MLFFVCACVCVCVCARIRTGLLVIMLCCVITTQREHTGSQQVLSQASEALARAIGLCLQHGLPSPILAEASLNMLECHGQLDPAMTGQYLALYQVLCRRSSRLCHGVVQ